MPLPSISMYKAFQCTARAKSTRQRCLSPAAYGCKICRLHGARKKSLIKRGKLHPNYRHGMETLVAKRERSKKLAELKAIETDVLTKGLVKRW